MRTKIFEQHKYMPVIITGVTEQGKWLDGYVCDTQDLNITIEEYVTKRPACVRVMVDIAITPEKDRTKSA